MNSRNYLCSDFLERRKAEREGHFEHVAKRERDDDRGKMSRVIPQICVTRHYH